MEDTMLREAVMRVAAEIGVEWQALHAVARVESGGRFFARVGNRAEPLIRFEGHFFYRLLPAQKRNRAVVGGLAHPVAGRVRNPSGQAARWQILHRACELHREAALSSVSWGVGQVMGAHWRWLGFASVEDLVSQARSGVEGQVRLFASYVAMAGLADKLNAHDWAGFARAYNGPDFARHGYDRRMAAAWREVMDTEGSVDRHGMAVLRLGARGPAVEALQENLRRIGHPLIADGDFGPATQSALIAFQSAAGITTDGAFGCETLEAMARRLPRKTSS